MQLTLGGEAGDLGSVKLARVATSVCVVNRVVGDVARLADAPYLVKRVRIGCRGRSRTRLPDIARAGVPGLQRVSRYEVHQVVMVEPKQVPRFLTLYQFSAETAEQVVAAMRTVDERPAKADRSSDLYVESGSAVVKQIKDVRR